MARYRHKSDEDMVWNDIRRRITAEVNVAMANARERVLNKALWGAWEKYTEALGNGELPELESKYSAFAHAVVADLIQVPEMVDSDASVE